MAVSLRLWDIGARSLWFDEAVEYWTANSHLTNLMLSVRNALQPPFYSIALHFWLLFGSGDVWLRLLSALAGMLGLAGMMLWGYRQRGWPGAVFNGLVMAVLPAEIRYAQEVGEYMLMECLVIWAIVALSLTFDTMKWRTWGLWASASILAVYTHYGAVVVIFALTLAALVENLFARDFRRAIRLAGIGLLSVVAWLPLLYFLPEQFGTQAHPESDLTFSAQQITRFFLAPAQTFAFPLAGWPYSRLPASLVYGLVAVLLVPAPLVWLRKPERAVQRTFAWLVTAFLVYYAAVISGYYAYGNFGYRYSMILTPLFVQSVMLIWTGISANRAGRLLSAAALVLILAISLYSLPNRSLSDALRGPTDWPEIQDVEQAVEYLEANNPYGTPTFVNYYASGSVRAYLHRMGEEGETDLPEDWLSQCLVPGHSFCKQANMVYGPWTRGKTGAQKMSTVEKAFGTTPDRFWLVSAYNRKFEDADLIEELAKTYRIVQQYQSVNVAVYLFEKKQP